MKTLKGFALAAAAASASAVLAFPAFAQQPAAPAAPTSPATPAAHRGRMQEIIKELGLDAKQVNQIKAIMKEQRAKAKAIQTDTKLDPTQKKMQIKDLRENTHKQIETLLTPEQKTKFEQLMPHGKRAGKKAGKHTNPAPPASPAPPANP